MKRLASIDIGTNSVLLLIAEVEGGRAVPLVERATITRLGQGVDSTRRLAPEAIERTLECLARYAEDLRAHSISMGPQAAPNPGALGAPPPEQLFVVGTSAMRDAEGGASFRERAAAILGVMPAVVSGDEEAELTFLGALSGLSVTGDVLVFDVGGGSTEIITGVAGGGMRHKISLDVGSVRLTERHVRSDPPSEDDLSRVRADVRAALASVPFRPSGQVVGVAGTVTTIAAFAREIVPYDAARVHGLTLPSSEVASATSALAALTIEQRRRLPAIDPKRADVIVAGAALVEEVLRFCGAEAMIVSDRGVRWGLIARAFGAH